MKLFTKISGNNNKPLTLIEMNSSYVAYYICDKQPNINATNRMSKTLINIFKKNKQTIQCYMFFRTVFGRTGRN